MKKPTYLQEVFTQKRLALAFEKLAALSDLAIPCAFENGGQAESKTIRKTPPINADDMMAFMLFTYCQRDLTYKSTALPR